jgi:alcohol dehydrogenase (cytochrome c)
MAAAVEGNNLMKRRVRVFAAAIVMLAAAFVTRGSSTMLGAGPSTMLRAGQAREFKPVTDAVLLNPDPADWPNWRRTLDGWGYSPLEQINTQNVHQLQLAWSWGLKPGLSQPNPLVANGTMYIPSPGGGVQALDAANGDLLWEYTPRPADGGGVRTSVMRSLAIYADKVYGAIADARLVALDARTGAVAWERQVADSKIGYSYSSGPIVVKGMIVAGITGCQRYKNDICFISAHDSQTGKEVWRTSTIAKPGEPGGDTWGELPLLLRAGGDAWIPGSYDPATNLIFWGTAQAKPWTRFARGTDGDALYTNCTLAIDPSNGKIVWY